MRQDVSGLCLPAMGEQKKQKTTQKGRKLSEECRRKGVATEEKEPACQGPGAPAAHRNFQWIPDTVKPFYLFSFVSFWTESIPSGNLFTCAFPETPCGGLAGFQGGTQHALDSLPTTSEARRAGEEESCPSLELSFPKSTVTDSDIPAGATRVYSHGYNSALEKNNLQAERGPFSPGTLPWFYLSTVYGPCLG